MSNDYISINTDDLDKKVEENLTIVAKKILKDRYMLTTDKNHFDLFKRVAATYSDNQEHFLRIYKYICNFWFMPATPILSNGGAKRGLPISCFLNEPEDSIKSISSLWNECVFLASNGGGIGTYWGNIRPIGDSIKDGKSGATSGVVPFIKVADSVTLAISQGSLRRGSAAAYLPINHPEIEEFLDIRRPVGDMNRRCLNIHNAVCIDDKFMEALKNNSTYELINPRNGKPVEVVKARDIWIKLLNARIETGEPYILYTDNVNKLLPETPKKLGLKIKTSNLCSEITLPTGLDHLNKQRTAVCCLSSLNLEYYDEWKDDEFFIEDVLRFLDNVLQDFIDNAPNEMANAKYSAERERSVGLGTMGFHSYLQRNMIPFDSIAAKSYNKMMFKLIKEKADLVSKKLATEKGACPDSIDAGTHERFSHKIAIAPTASISIICGGSSPGIEPFSANLYNQKTLSGNFIILNKYLKNLLKTKNLDNDEIWSQISANAGSVMGLDCLTKEEKDVFKTAFEIKQQSIIDFAADRTPYVCQAQSLNIFVAGDVEKTLLHKIHYSAWEKGVKSLYYCRSKAVSRAETVSNVNTSRQDDSSEYEERDLYEECTFCQ